MTPSSCAKATPDNGDRHNQAVRNVNKARVNLMLSRLSGLESKPAVETWAASASRSRVLTDEGPGLSGLVGRRATRCCFQPRQETPPCQSPMGGPVTESTVTENTHRAPSTSTW